ncbi:SDR family NAD(P)-dependent oxidoreductase [Palleronia caenipelagi]|uniref:SDR family oxidoreductase n=1 Tax=Palleronia caenipelagi TaxID=2489174 RepID=A0A547Q2K4_9RHOB|nr:SDR family NAD(P)-dependent oxidoreductase [Palleronia caenipelagi]TRD20622.1 SDR family oxidoreductase [Palleronia caenipelagi]
MFDLKDKVVLVTGANSGIGKAAALGLAKAGATVVVSDLPGSDSDETMKEVREHAPDSIFIGIDVADEDSVAKGIADIVEKFGRLDVGVNNAGIGGGHKPLHETSAEEWNKVVNVNLTGQFYCVKHELLQFLKQGGGTIVNVASLGGLLTIPGEGSYIASKHGSLGLTKTIAAEYGNKGIRANAVCPYYIATPMTANADEATLKAWKADTPMERLGSPEECASAVVFFASDASGYCNGDTLVLDGGKHIR